MTDQEMIDQNWRELQAQMKPEQSPVMETITTEDRLRGAIIAAMEQIATGHPKDMIYLTLQQALRL
jgi:hypothetical protein